jgi:hypothetical protein
MLTARRKSTSRSQKLKIMQTKTSAKRLLTAFFAAAFILSAVFTIVSQQASAADGTTGTPDTAWYNGVQTEFEISTADQLAGLAEIVNGGTDSFSGKKITITENIDLSVYGDGSGFNGGKGWISIGIAVPDRPFSGIFDGNNKNITGLYINDSARDFTGLFGKIDGGTVKGLSVAGELTTGKDSGGIVGNIIDGVLERCSFIGSVTYGGTASNTGGMAGVINNTSVKDCHVKGNVTGYTSVGGIIGSVGGICTVSGSYFDGNVKGYDYVGGIIGNSEVNAGNIEKCYSKGTVKATVTSANFGIAGGIAGIAGTNITDCYSLSDVDGYDYVGGISGRARGVTSNCYSTGDVTGRNYVGGITGQINGPYYVVKNCVALGPELTKTGANYGRVAAFFASAAPGSDLRNNYANGAMTGGGTNIGHDKLDGASISMADALTAAFWTAGTAEWTAWNEDVWYMVDGALPIFKFQRIVDADTPVISSQPQGTAVSVDGSVMLSVTASVTDGGTLAYQWYVNTANSLTGATPIAGATDTSYDVPTGTIGTLYYFCIITNTITEDGTGGTKTISIPSDIAAVKVTSGSDGTGGFD